MLLRYLSCNRMAKSAEFTATTTRHAIVNIMMFSFLLSLDKLGVVCYYWLAEYSWYSASSGCYPMSAAISFTTIALSAVAAASTRITITVFLSCSRCFSMRCTRLSNASNSWRLMPSFFVLRIFLLSCITAAWKISRILSFLIQDEKQKIQWRI